MSLSEKEKLIVEWRKCRNSKKRSELLKKIRTYSESINGEKPIELPKQVEKANKKPLKSKILPISKNETVESITKEEE